LTENFRLSSPASKSERHFAGEASEPFVVRKENVGEAEHAFRPAERLDQELECGEALAEEEEPDLLDARVAHLARYPAEEVEVDIFLRLFLAHPQGAEAAAVVAAPADLDLHRARRREDVAHPVRRNPGDVVDPLGDAHHCLP